MWNLHYVFVGMCGLEFGEAEVMFADLRYFERGMGVIGTTGVWV